MYNLKWFTTFQVHNNENTQNVTKVCYCQIFLYSLTNTPRELSHVILMST